MSSHLKAWIFTSSLPVVCQRVVESPDRGWRFWPKTTGSYDLADLLRSKG